MPYTSHMLLQSTALWTTPGAEVEKKKKRVAYGVFEGIRPEGELAQVERDWESLTQGERDLKGLGSGLWGGALPPDS
jgi:hypothetical protein